MNSSSQRNFVFDTIDDISRLTSLPQVAEALVGAAEKFGFTSLGISALPPPGEGTDPVVLTETIPAGFRELYTEERFYLVDHIGMRARTACLPFRYCEAPYHPTRSAGHRRFMQALATYGLGKGLIVPIGRPANIPACVWLAGPDPDLDDDSKHATQMLALFAATKARALAHPPALDPQTSRLTPREREVLQWISAGKTSWEIAAILILSERTINKIVADAMTKLDAVTRTQAVVHAIQLGEIAL